MAIVVEDIGGMKEFVCGRWCLRVPRRCWVGQGVETEERMVHRLGSSPIHSVHGTTEKISVPLQAGEMSSFKSILPLLSGPESRLRKGVVVGW